MGSLINSKPFKFGHKMKLIQMKASIISILLLQFFFYLNLRTFTMPSISGVAQLSGRVNFCNKKSRFCLCLALLKFSVFHTHKMVKFESMAAV